MNAIRAFAAFAFVAALMGAMLTVATSTAHADSLDSVRGPVNGVRQSSACPALNYSVALEGEAQFLAGNNLPGVPPRGQYKGTFQGFGGAGDPINNAVNDALGKATPTIKNCDFKDYGVGFIRQDNMNPPDHVAIVLGQPAPPPVVNTTCPDGSTVPAGQQCPVKPATTTCPDGSTVPAGQQCPVKPATTACPDGSSVSAGRNLPGHQRDQGVLRSPRADQNRSEGGKLIEPDSRVSLRRQGEHEQPTGPEEHNPGFQSSRQSKRRRGFQIRPYRYHILRNDHMQGRHRQTDPGYW